MKYSLANNTLWFAVALLIAGSVQAETVAVALSQEQDGGAQGRACIYVYQGRAEFRRVNAGEACQPEIIINVTPR